MAPELLGKVLVTTIGGAMCSGRIIETEAYMPDDPASHTFRGETSRNAAMFGPAGHLYVYLSYGIHHCTNVVTGGEGSGQAVLVRAIEPLEGIEEMRRRRPGRTDTELANGPGKLASALGIDLRHDGIDIVGAIGSTSSIRVLHDGVAPPDPPTVGPRVGITRGTQTPWRFRRPPDG